MYDYIIQANIHPLAFIFSEKSLHHAKLSVWLEFDYNADKREGPSSDFSNISTLIETQGLPYLPRGSVGRTFSIPCFYYRRINLDILLVVNISEMKIRCLSNGLKYWRTQINMRSSAMNLAVLSWLCCSLLATKGGRRGGRRIRIKMRRPPVVRADWEMADLPLTIWNLKKSEKYILLDPRKAHLESDKYSLQRQKKEEDQRQLGDSWQFQNWPQYQR